MTKRAVAGIPAAVALACTGARLGYSQAATTITVTDKVAVRDCQRFGINLGGDAYYSGAVLVKKRVCENFEGSTYRQCHFGPLQDEHGATTWFNPPEGWRKLLAGGTYTILSGPAKGISGTIRDITTKKVEHQGKMKDFAYFVFDREVPAGPPNVGLLVEAHRPDEGHFRRMEEHEHWTTHNNKLEIGDPPPGSFGNASLNLDAGERAAHVRFSTHYHRYGALNGTWQVRFWARAKSGSPSLKVGFVRSDWGESADVPLTSRWTRSELALEVTNVPEPKDPKDNHHITHGDGPLEPRNRIVASLGGGLNVANSMLQMLKEGGARTQALFSLVQHSYNAHNIGAVRLWGTALCLRKGHERYRPTFLACATANKVLGGDLLETLHSDSEPTFDATGVFSRRRGKESLTGLPCLFSYAFADGERQGMIMVNLDTAKTHAVRLVVPGSTPGPARTWLLAADAITANKEFEQAEPQVRVVEGRLTDFPPPRGIDLPPHSLMAVAWETPR